jgi:hypothetical protein
VEQEEAVGWLRLKGRAGLAVCQTGRGSIRPSLLSFTAYWRTFRLGSSALSLCFVVSDESGSPTFAAVLSSSYPSSLPFLLSLPISPVLGTPGLQPPVQTSIESILANLLRTS